MERARQAVPQTFHLDLLGDYGKTLISTSYVEPYVDSVRC